MKVMGNTKGLSIKGNKATIDLNRHGNIMEDAIDRIKVKEAMATGEFIDWEDAKQQLDKKHSTNGVQNSNRKESTKVSGNRSKKRLPEN